MGCCCSTPFRVNKLPGQGENVLKIASKLKLSKQNLNRIYKQFRDLDTDNSGVVDVIEFIVMNNITSELFGELVFSLFDANKSGKLDFEEYLIAIWNYCSLNKDGLAKFAFDIFDVDSSGSLSLEEIKDIMEIIWGDSDNAILQTKALTSLSSQKASHDTNDVTTQEFVQMSNKIPTLLFPVFEVQEKLINCKAGLGRSRWAKISAQRFQDFGKRTVFEILSYEPIRDQPVKILSRRSSIVEGAQGERIRKMSRTMQAKSSSKHIAKNKETSSLGSSRAAATATVSVSVSASNRGVVGSNRGGPVSSKKVVPNN